MQKERIENYFIIAMIIIIIIGINFIIRGKKNLNNTNNLEIEENISRKEIFEDYYEEANKKLAELTLEEKIGQLFLVRYPNENALEDLKQYKFGGYLLFEKDFKDKTEEIVKHEINELQNASNIPLFIAVDEEGGDVVRVSSNSNLSKEKFKSPNELYNLGEFEKIKEDTIEKSRTLYNLGINLNLAPVVDVSTNKNDYMYKRTLGKDTNLTSIFAKTVIEASKEGKVSYTLKHFPGYGNNVDTHKGAAIDNKTYEDIEKYDLPPFIAGIKAGAEAVLVSHNIINSIDENNPASLSYEVHDLLRNKLKFTGVIITDDLDMGAVASDADKSAKAIISGNDLIIVTDYKGSIENVKRAMEEGRISQDLINNKATKILAWKYYKGMM